MASSGGACNGTAMMEASVIQSEGPPARVVLGDVVLERWRPGDVDPLFTAISANIEHLRPWMPWAASHARDAVVQFLADSDAGWHRGERFEYAVRNQTGEVLGSAGLMDRIGPGGLEIGYWIHAQHTRKGIATLVAAALSEIGLGLSTVDHVEIHHDEANIASSAIPARLGFRHIGTFRVDPKAPSEVGHDVRWRLDAAQFATSPARSLLDGARGMAPHPTEPPGLTPRRR